MPWTERAERKGPRRAPETSPRRVRTAPKGLRNLNTALTTFCRRRRAPIWGSPTFIRVCTGRWGGLGEGGEGPRSPPAGDRRPPVTGLSPCPAPSSANTALSFLSGWLFLVPVSVVTSFWGAHVCSNVLVHTEGRFPVPGKSGIFPRLCALLLGPQSQCTVRSSRRPQGRVSPAVRVTLLLSLQGGEGGNRAFSSQDNAVSRDFRCRFPPGRAGVHLCVRGGVFGGDRP